LIGFDGLFQLYLFLYLARSYGAKVIFVNEEATDVDDQADYVVHGKVQNFGHIVVVTDIL